MTGLQKIFAGLALLLGIAHIIFGIVVFKSYTLETVWFIGAGVAMIAVALINLSSQMPLKIRLGLNLMMVIYTFAILGVLIAPQVIIACVLFGGLFAVSVIQLSKQN